MIDHFSSLRRKAIEKGVPFDFIEQYDLKTDTSTMKLRIGEHRFQSEKKGCKTSDDIDINRKNLIDMVTGSIIDKFNTPITL